MFNKKFVFYQIKRLIYSLLLLEGIMYYISSSAYSGENPGHEEKIKGSGNYNVIMVMLDTLRADHLACYGYFRKTAPNIEKLAQKGILFEWAISQSSFTLPSHASLFTSKCVKSHKVDRIERRLPENEFTLAQILRDSGYKTAAFIYNASQLDPVYGLNKGFDLYDYGYEQNNLKPSFEKTLPAALKWIGQHKNDKFFVFLHSNDIHEPYRSPFENFFDPDYKGCLDNETFGTSVAWHKNNLTRSAREVRHIIAHYDGGIKYADTFVGRLIDQLKEWSLMERTIIIVLSDHGEILGDRGMRFQHAFSVHDEEVRVPLIIVHPQIKRALRIKTQVQLIDVMPGILDFLSIKAVPKTMEGASFRGLIEGNSIKGFSRYAYAECMRGESEKVGIINRHVLVRTSAWSLIQSTCQPASAAAAKEKFSSMGIELADGSVVEIPVDCGYELYNLKRDPKQKINLMDKGYKKMELELINKLILFCEGRQN